MIRSGQSALRHPAEQTVRKLTISQINVLRDRCFAASSAWGIFLMPLKDYLMLRSAHGARLEALPTSLQFCIRRINQFPDSLLRGPTTPDRRS